MKVSNPFLLAFSLFFAMQRHVLVDSRTVQSRARCHNQELGGARRRATRNRANGTKTAYWEQLVPRMALACALVEPGPPPTFSPYREP